MNSIYHKHFIMGLISSLMICTVLKTQDLNRIENISIPLSVRFESSDYKGGMQCWSFDQDSNGILYVGNNNGLLEFDGQNWIRHVVPNSNKLRCVMVDSRNRIIVGGQGQIGYFIRGEGGLVYNSLMELLPDEYKYIAETWTIIEADNKVYFSTESQLLEYDGTDLKLIELPGVLVASFLVKDQVWVQIYEQGLYRLHKNKIHEVPNTREVGEIRNILFDDGKYYFITSIGSIFNYSDGNLINVELSQGLGYINSAIRMRNGDIVIGTHNNGLFILSSDLKIKSHYTKNQGISDRTVRALYEDNFNNLWIALNNGIDYLEISLPFTLINDEVGLEGTGYAACLHKNKLYLGTNNGLFFLSGTDENTESYHYELIPGSEGQVYNLSVVNDQLILNHHHGAFLINDNELDQFHSIGSWKLKETALEGLYIGGDYRGINFYKQNGMEFENLGSIPDFIESSRMFEFDSDTSLWMTHGSKGAYRFYFDNEMQLKGEIKLYDQNNGFPSDYKISIYPIINNLVFAAETGVYEYDHEKDLFERNKFFDSWLGDDHISALISGDDHSIYFIQDDKFGKLKHLSFENYTKDTAIFKHVNKLISDDLRNISVIDKNHVLIGGKEGFIIYYPERDTKKVDEFNVLIRSVEIELSADSIKHIFNPHERVFSVHRNQSVRIQYSSPYFEGYDELTYSYRLLPLDTNWSQWSKVNMERFSFLPANEYTFEVKAKNIYNSESIVKSISFKVVNPWYLSDFAIMGYVLLGLIIILLILVYQKNRFAVEKTMITDDKDKVLKIKDQEISQISEESKRKIESLQNDKLRTEINLKNDQLNNITMQMMNYNTKIQDALHNILFKLEKGGSRDELKRIIRSIEKDMIKNDSWDEFAHHFDQVHGDFLHKLSGSNIRLTPREIKLAAFLRMNLSSKEISKMMNITVQSVELARHRLRKKLKLERDQNLVEYLIGLDNQ